LGAVVLRNWKKKLERIGVFPIIPVVLPYSVLVGEN
jgi:hypothetical protein